MAEFETLKYVLWTFKEIDYHYIYSSNYLCDNNMTSILKKKRFYVFRGFPNNSL